MRRLSNLHQTPDVEAAAPPSIAAPSSPTTVDTRTTARGDGLDRPHCRRAERTEVDVALRLILGAGAPGGAGDAQVVDFLSYALHRGIDLTDVWVVTDPGGRIAWATLPVVSPGRTMLLLTPAHVPPVEGIDTLAGELVGETARHFARRDVQLAQALVDPHDARSLALFGAAGFARLAELIYLQRPLPRPAAGAPLRSPPLPEGLIWETYSPASHDRFARAIVESYERSLDCPALNGRRDIEDVIAGHKSAGEFDPDSWFLLSERGTPRAVLLLARARNTDVVELVYLGLPPGSRGRGLGSFVLSHAIAVAAHAGAARLSLAVDALNAPALRLYYRHGFQRVCSRVAVMRDLRE